MRAAIYARYSSDMQKPESIEDQIRQCRAYIARQGWIVPDDCLYEDRAVSGSDDTRIGYNAMKTAASRRFFDYVVVDDLSRLGRNTEESISTFKGLTALGVNIVGVADGIDTANKSAKIPFYFRSVLNEIFLDDLREKVLRGLGGQVVRGYSAGGRVYGYRYIEVIDPTGAKDRLGRIRRLGVRIEIDEDQAAVVRLIYNLRLKGLGLKAIARHLNVKQIPPPRLTQRGTGETTWSASTANGILLQPKYIGDWCWKKTKWVKLPGTSKRIKIDRPQSEWVENRQEHLRIIPEDQWTEVQSQRALYKPKHGFRNGKLTGYHGGDNRGKYIFSGLLKCSVCGGNLVVIRSGDYSAFVCNRHWSRGDEACTNSLRVSRALVEEILLSSIRKRLLTPEIVLRAVRGLEKKIKAYMGRPVKDTERKGEELVQLEREVENLTHFVIGGDTSDSIRAALHEKESRLKAVRASIRTTTTPANLIPFASPEWIRERVSAMSELLRVKPEDLGLVRLELKNILADQIVMEPTETGRNGYYVAHVKGVPLNIFKGTALSMMVNSATGNRTPV